MGIPFDQINWNWVLYFVLFVVDGYFWGWATSSIRSNKGYHQKWFWWGFFFAIFPYVIATTQLDVSTESENNLDFANAALDATRKQILTSGGWRCACGNVNIASRITCSCGKTKKEYLDAVEKIKQDNYLKTKNAVAQNKQKALLNQLKLSEYENVVNLKHWKILLDSGEINEDEFISRKKALSETVAKTLQKPELQKETLQKPELQKEALQKPELQKEAPRQNRQGILSQAAQSAALDKIDILFEYGDLLASGVITEEEFEKKKAEWLQMTRQTL
jgi:hypothetical protein